MRKNFNSIFSYIFLFSLLQSNVAFGQDTLQNARRDSSVIYKEPMIEENKDNQIISKDFINQRKTGGNSVNTITNKLDPKGKTDSSTTAKTDTLIYKNKQQTPNINLNTHLTGNVGYQRQYKDSVFKRINFNNIRYNSQLPQIDVKKNLTIAEESLLIKKSFLLAKNNHKLKEIKPKVLSFFGKQLKAIKPQGSVSFGYEYGVLPYVMGNNYPSGGYKTEGKVSMLVLNIPLELSYCYSNIQNVIGFNNHFRISYDANRYKEQLNQVLNVKDKFNQHWLGALQADQQKVLQKIEYLNFLKQNSSYKIPAYDSLKTEFPDKFNINTKLNTSDSLHFTQPNLSLQSKIDSVKNYYSYAQKRDSITREINKYKARYNDIQDDINEVEKEIDQAKNFLNNPTALINPYLSKVQQFASHIRKFEIGLCSPSYSTFLVNNVPLQGINMEYGAKDVFFAFTYGTTVNNLLYNTNTIQGAMQGVRNVYNYFDFGNLSAGRKILSVKGGLGAKDDTHLYVGFLVGKGRSDYLQPISDPTSYSKESNVVMELDGKYKFSQHLSADVVLGKSSVQEENLTMEQVRKAVDEILSRFRSYALLAKVNLDVSQTNTKLSFTTRWIDPFFKSFGIGFIRSDNFRYEIKAEQPITKKIKYTIAYRREEDNLLKLYDYKNTLKSINNSLNFKINRELNIRLNYAPLFRELKSASTIIKDKNEISSVILSFIPKTKKINAQFNFLYSKYIISGDSSKINFENYTYSQQLQFHSGFKTSFNASWLRNSLKDTMNSNNVYLAVLDVGYTAKNNNSLTIGGKAACKTASQPQYGFIIKATLSLYKGLYWETSAEKIIIGDYYNNLLIGQIRKFPYYCSSKLIFKF